MPAISIPPCAPADRRRHGAGAASVVQAQKFRRWYREQVLKLFGGRRDPGAGDAPRPGSARELRLTRSSCRCAPIGLYTQPISFIGLPVVALPVPLEPLPIGVQIIAAPWREDVALRIAHPLEREGVAAAPRPAERANSE
jgi:aspartyl-tRNA(Asn)/glutamyl-tRNA(Gln) amidotransferase subunit A